LHVFVHRGQRRSFTSNSQNRVVSQVCLDLAKPSRPSRRLSNETIDETRARNLVEAAAGYRLRKKCEAFQRAAFLRGKDEALFSRNRGGNGIQEQQDSLPAGRTAHWAGPGERHEWGSFVIRTLRLP